jgi:eukaryotic-like serine/threonine-protein kinase
LAIPATLSSPYCYLTQQALENKVVLILSVLSDSAKTTHAVDNGRMPASILKFGEGFELDPAAYELRRSGRPQKLERIPMEILLLFVDRRGQLVTREEIIEKVWGKGVFLDTDNGINAAISKLRQVLRDDPENPASIQTMKGKGYRFIAAVTEAAVAGLPQAAVCEAESAVASGPEDKVKVAPVASPHAAPRVSNKIQWISLLVAVAVLAGLALAFFLRFHRKPALTEKDTIVLADFANTTGDAVFDGTLRQGLAVELEQSPFLSLISDNRIQQILRLMGQPGDARLTPEIAMEVCERIASAAVIDGSISSLGSQYVLGLRAKDCRTGKLFYDQQLQVPRKEDLLHALSGMANDFRGRAGESLATVKEHAKPLEEATTPSLEALRAFSTAINIQVAKGSASAIPLLKRAIELDPNFALAYAYLGRLYGDIGELDLSAENTAKAYQLREHASDPERFFIVAHYQIAVTGNLEKAAQTCETWAATYPRDKAPHGFRGGLIYPVLGNYEQALEQSKEVTQLDPDFPVGHGILSNSYIFLNDFKSAENALQVASARPLEIPDFAVLRYDLAFLRGNQVEMERQAALGEKIPGARDWIFARQASALAYHGLLSDAEKLSQQAVALAQEADQRERAAQFQAAIAVRGAFLGKRHAAQQSAVAALKISKGRDVQYGAALAFALAGDVSRATAMTKDLEKRLPEDTVVRVSYVPTLRAALALNQGAPDKAIEALQVTTPHELGSPPSAFLGPSGALYPVYMRGNAYLAAHRGKQAAEEFQKILDHRGVVLSDPIGALVHLQLGRAYTLTGDKDKARTVYQEFLALWKNADQDVPILKQAQAEYAKLR